VEPGFWTGLVAQQVMVSGDEEILRRIAEKAATTEEWLESIRREDAGRW